MRFSEEGKSDIAEYLRAKGAVANRRIALEKVRRDEAYKVQREG